MLINCTYCDEEFYKEEYRIKNSKTKNHFCSRKCYNSWQRDNGGKSYKSYNRINKECEVCKKEFTVPKYKENTAKYCSVDCRIKGRIVRKEVVCDYCSSVFYKKPSLVRNKNFCNKLCSAEWNSKFNNRQVKIECLICGKEFKVQRDRKDTAKTCSRKCHSKWLSEHYAKTEEGKNHYRKNGIQTTLNQGYSETKPERILKEFLIENNIEFIPQHLMYDKFVVDFYLPKENMIIEVFGDYWHGNPLFYGDSEETKPLTKKQIKQKKKDKSRQAYLEKCGHKFHIFWENDIYNKLSKITKFLIE